MYERSDGVDEAMSEEERLSKAWHHYRASAEQHNAFSHLKMGDFFYYGKGFLNQSYDQAVSYYRVASDLRNAQATFNLGYMQHHGLGVAKDLHLSKRFYDLSAEIRYEKRRVLVSKFDSFATLFL